MGVKFLFNCYQHSALGFVWMGLNQETAIIRQEEGVGQGDMLGMVCCDMVIMPMLELSCQHSPDMHVQHMQTMLHFAVGWLTKHSSNRVSHQCWSAVLLLPKA